VVNTALGSFCSCLIAGLLVAACGSSSDDDAASATAAGGASATGAGGSGVGQGGIGSKTCAPPCKEGQFCSATGTCINDGNCLDDLDCKTGTVCDLASSTCVPGGGCGAQEAKAEAIPPNMLIVLDRSCSMTEKVGMKTKWEIAVAALDTLTTTYAGKIRFGLTLFPDLVTPDCQQDVIPIPVAPSTEMAVQSLLNAALVAADQYFPDGPCVTNIDTAVQQAATEPAFADKTRASFALLVTDGQQAGCTAGGGNMGTLATITDLWTNQKVGTFVVGFGGAVDAASLNSFAMAGGVPSADPTTKYYQADDQASLDAALALIASQTIGCVFKLDPAPPDPSKVYVFFDNTQSIAQDPTHTDGWDYDPASQQVTFYGASCDKLKNGDVTDVDIVFGCNEPTPN
jgi:hypothetical protein